MTLGEQLRAFYSSLEPGRRRVLVLAAALSLAAVIGVGVWSLQPDYVLLTRAADPDEAQTIAHALAQAEVPYSIDADGVSVRVPRASQVEGRRAASGDGGIVGLEGLEKIDPWVTPFQEQLHKLRMMQGELVRTLNAITGISTSTVHITFPERTTFVGDADRPTAAVTLRPDVGTTINHETARSVAELVSHAVTGMSAEDVTVVDASTGRLLFAGGREESDPTKVNEGELAAMEIHKEGQLSEGVQAALAQLLGRDNAATVTVKVELERSAVNQTVNAVDPDSSVTSSEKIESETNDSANGAPSGVPGTDSNLPERAGSTTTGGSSARNRETQQSTYQFTTTTTTTVTPPGDVRRLSAAVMIDEKAVTAAAAGGDEKALRAQLEAGVRAALGASDKRGDSVIVSFVPFAPEVADTTVAEAAEAETATWQRWLPVAVAAAMILLAFALFVRPVLAAARAPAVARGSGDIVLRPDGLVDDEDGEPVVHLNERLRARIARLDAHQPSHVSELVLQESAHSAEVLRRWIRS